jgi:4-hydroxy-3-methylbut-2-enyl diphosphate reductase IspH
MAVFYFFEKDDNCRWLRKEIREQYSKYLFGPVEWEGRQVKFYVILDWVMRTDRGANLEWVKEFGGNVVPSVEDLPLEAGVFITGYDCDLEERRELEARGIPIIDRACPWVKEFRDQLLSLDQTTHQAVVMIDQGHMVRECYRSIIPTDAILVGHNDFVERIRTAKDPRRALKLIVYTVFRPQDAERASDFIRKEYPHPANDLDGYKRSLCVWTKQGLLEEMREAIPRERLKSVWIICSSDVDRSTRSLINQATDCGAEPLILRSAADIPVQVADGDRIGVLMAPIPMPRAALALKEEIRRRFTVAAPGDGGSSFLECADWMPGL